MFSTPSKLPLLFLIILSATYVHPESGKKNIKKSNTSIPINQNKEFNRSVIDPFPYFTEGFALIKNPVSFHDFMHEKLFNSYIQENTNPVDFKEKETFISQLAPTIEAAENIITTQMKNIIYTYPENPEAIASIANYIAKYNRTFMDEILYASGPDKQILLHKVASQNNAQVMKALIKTQCDLNTQDAQGNTPLHYAAQANINTGHFYKDEVSQLLINAGADTSIQNKRNEYPFDYISESHILFQAHLNAKAQAQITKLRLKKHSLDTLINKCNQLQAEQNKLSSQNNDLSNELKSTYLQSRHVQIKQTIHRNKIDIAVAAQVLQTYQQIKEKKLKKAKAKKLN